MSAPLCKRRLIAGLLVGPVSAVPIMSDHVETELLGKRRSVIRTCVVSQNDVVNDLQRNLIHCSLNGLRGVISR